MVKYQPTVGLEIHVELKTKSKMFCSCRNDPEERHPNVNICPICMGHPGTLPTINWQAVKKVIKTGLALNCQIPEYSQFDRKNYFYPDLPKGYQISQLYNPLCIKGFLEIDGKKIRIKEIHLEEDTGSLIHPPGADYSLVNFNRAGIPLMELATEPDMRSAKEAREFAQAFHLIMHYLGVSDADMEKGQMRVEVNVSLARNVVRAEEEGSSSSPSKEKGKLGTKVEIKNLNSFRSVEQAIEYEIKRQTGVLDKGKRVIQETRGWNSIKGVTVSQRKKETAQDYRYFPEPDLPPLCITKEIITEIRSEIPELPAKKRERLIREYGLDEKNAEIFVYNKPLGEFFEKVISELPPNLAKNSLLDLIKLGSNYIITDLQGLLEGDSVSNETFKITPENFAEFITLIHNGQISSKIAKQILGEMFKAGADPSNIIKEKGLSQITNESEIEEIIKEVILKNSKVVEDFKSGKTNAFQYLIGQIMATSRGKANPETASKILTKYLQ